MLRLAAIVILAPMLAACAAHSQIRTRTETVTVRVPVPVKQTPPQALTDAPELEAPRFVAPDHPEASSALTPAGEAALRGLLGELLARDRAWREWAVADTNTAIDGARDEW
jgi:hypothetical protein